MSSANSREGEKTPALIYCPMCTHTVEGYVLTKGKKLVVAPGQSCTRCRSALDAGYVMRRERAA